VIVVDVRLAKLAVSPSRMVFAAGAVKQQVSAPVKRKNSIYLGRLITGCGRRRSSGISLFKFAVH
jgi:hypothetical protein